MKRIATMVLICMAGVAAVTVSCKQKTDNPVETK